jgi:metal-responsive CopG/Arc/MetJ family transcriptional regulator
MASTRKVRISLSLSLAVLREIDRLARLERVSRSAYIETVLREFLQNQLAQALPR